MEKLPHQEFRDELAGKLREIRNSDEENPELARAKAQGYLEAKKEEPRPENRRLTNYKESKKAHQRLNERGINFGEIEAVLNSLKTNQKLVVTAGGQERTIGSMFANASIEYEENTGKLEVALKYEDLFDGGVNRDTSETVRGYIDILEKNEDLFPESFRKHGARISFHAVSTGVVERAFVEGHLQDVKFSTRAALYG